MAGRQAGGGEARKRRRPRRRFPRSKCRAVRELRGIARRLEIVAVFRYSKLEWIANAISYVPLAAKNHRWLPARRASSRAAAIFNAGRMDLRALSYVAESDGLVTATTDGLRAAGAFHTGRAAFLVVWPLAVPGP